MREDGELALEELPGIVVERARDPRHGDFATPVAPPACEGARPQAARHSRAAGGEAVGYRAVRAGRGRRSRLRELPPLGGGPAGRGVAGIGRGRGLRPLRRGVVVGVFRLEFVSSNPTGPLHVGHGRNAAFGAVLANLLDAVGFDVQREYYVNDIGRQMDTLALSVVAALPRAQGRASHFSRPGLSGRLSPRDRGRPGGGAR